MGVGVVGFLKFPLNSTSQYRISVTLDHRILKTWETSNYDMSVKIKYLHRLKNVAFSEKYGIGVINKITQYWR